MLLKFINTHHPILTNFTYLNKKKSPHQRSTYHHTAKKVKNLQNKLYKTGFLAYTRQKLLQDVSIELPIGAMLSLRYYLSLTYLSDCGTLLLKEISHFGGEVTPQ